MAIQPRARMTLKPITFTPFEKAQFEIICLDHEPALRQESVIGGPMPPEMQEENNRKREEYQKRKLAIIEKHGVAAEYLEPLLQEEQLLLNKLLSLQQKIAQLRALVK